MTHRMIAMAGQILGELRRHAFLAGEADDRAAPQRPAFQCARQRKSPRRPVREKRYDAARPEQENVAARKVVAHTPAENARSQDQESSAPGAQHGCEPDRPTPSGGSGCRASAPASRRRRGWRQRWPLQECENIRPRIRRGSCGRSSRRTSRSQGSAPGRRPTQPTRSTHRRSAGATGVRAQDGLG